MSRIAKDQNNETVPLMELSAPQNGIANAASTALSQAFVRIHPVTDCYILFSAAGTACNSTTGHKLAAGGCYDLPTGEGKNKVYISGTADLSELG